jgi:hypothetical protein
MVLKNHYSTMVFLLLCFGTIHSQESIHHASGGEAIGSGGTVSYTVGLPIYTTYSGAEGEIAQGVQHAFEILMVTGTEENGIILEMDVFPNPTTSVLHLRVANYGLQDLTCQLYDTHGRLLDRRPVISNMTSIPTEQLAAATYYLQVTNAAGQTLKTFQIIKRY